LPREITKPTHSRPSYMETSGVVGGPLIARPRRRRRRRTAPTGAPRRNRQALRPKSRLSSRLSAAAATALGLCIRTCQTCRSGIGRRGHCARGQDSFGHRSWRPFFLFLSSSHIHLRRLRFAAQLTNVLLGVVLAAARGGRAPQHADRSSTRGLAVHGFLVAALAFNRGKPFDPIPQVGGEH
jgi:hypothetical protein